MIELPTAPFVAATLDNLAWPVGARRWGSYRLRLRNEAEDYEAIVFGNDIPALLDRGGLPAGVELALHPLFDLAVSER